MKKSIRPCTAQSGFTLLELMVAMMIFAVMAVFGWQIMDALTQSRDRAKAKITTVRALQYAYETLAQDLAQTSNYVALPPTVTGGNFATISITPTFILNTQGIAFTRMAPPDPRVAVSPALARIGYSVVDNKLIKSQFSTLLPSGDENANTSILLNEVSDAKWTAFTPNPAVIFPDMNSLQKPIVTPTTGLPTNTGVNSPAKPAPSIDISAYQQLPKGIELQFIYQQTPIIWRFALPDGSPNTMGLNSGTAEVINR